MSSTAAWQAAEYEQQNSGQYQSAMEALAVAGAHTYAGGRFADVGCGSGEIAAAMAEREFTVTANDGSESMVDATRRRCAGLPVTADVQDAHALELPAGAFDVVHSSWMLHWLTDHEHAVSTLAGAVRPGGVLVLQWSFGQPASAGFPMRDVLDGVVARPAWRDRLAAAPLAMYQHPVERVRATLEAAGLTVLVEEPVQVPGPRDPASLRAVTKTTAFATQAAALGDDADTFVDEALRALFEAGELNVHNTRLIATRPDPDGDERPPALIRPFPQSIGVLTVKGTESLTPLMRRITFTGALRDLVVSEPGEIITLFWPAAGADLELPEPWRLVDGQHTRNFTVRFFDRVRGELTVDFYLHGADGFAARWAADAVPGEQVGYAGCRVHWTTDKSAAWSLLAGDETALPAISAIAASRPAGHRTIVVAAVRDGAEHPALEAGTAEVHWVSGGGDLTAYVRDLELPDGRGQVWAAGSAEAMRDLRKHLVGDRRVPRDGVVALAYWR